MNRKRIGENTGKKGQGKKEAKKKKKKSTRKKYGHEDETSVWRREKNVVHLYKTLYLNRDKEASGSIRER